MSPILLQVSFLLSEEGRGPALTSVFSSDSVSPDVKWGPLFFLWLEGRFLSIQREERVSVVLTTQNSSLYLLSSWLALQGNCPFPREVPEAETENLRDCHWLRPNRGIQRTRTDSCTPVHFPLSPENCPHFSQTVAVTDPQGCGGLSFPLPSCSCVT